MTALVAIRTNRWDEATQRIWHALRNQANMPIALVFHDRPAGLELPLPVADISTEWVVSQSLRPVADWGWRCGDYAYYALRAKFPQHDYYWLIEPDVCNTLDWGPFFERLSAAPHDALGHSLTRPHAKHPFAWRPPYPDAITALFPLTRFSGRALDILLEERRAYSRLRLPEHRYANDEVFSFTVIGNRPDLSLADLVELAPEYFDGTHFRSNPDILESFVRNRAGRHPGIYHPVRSTASFLSAAAERLAGAPRLSRIIGPSIDYLSEAEIEALFAQVAQRLIAARQSSGGA